MIIERRKACSHEMVRSGCHGSDFEIQLKPQANCLLKLLNTEYHESSRGKASFLAVTAHLVDILCKAASAENIYLSAKIQLLYESGGIDSNFPGF